MICINAGGEQRAAAVTALEAAMSGLASPQSRWRSRYEELISSAQDLGIPRYGLPEVGAEASEQELRDAMEHVALVISSYLSADI